jgi:hypothetical protein
VFRIGRLQRGLKFKGRERKQPLGDLRLLDKEYAISETAL